jgi:sulfate permease, SulP family
VTERSVEPAPDVPIQVHQPGLHELRDVVARRLGQWRPHRGTLRRDALAGLSLAVANVPDGMADALMVGINPIHGLYATVIGPIVGGSLSSTQLMVITTTAAASLTASQALAGVQPGMRMMALFLMTTLVGIFLVTFVALRLQRFVRFVSYSVTTGLLAGISVLLILSQLPTVAGYAPSGGNRIARTLDLLRHFRAIDLYSVATGALALTLAVLLPRTRLGSLGRLLSIAVPSALTVTLGLDSVAVVSDVGDIPRGFPTPALPEWSALTPALIGSVATGALSVAAVILVQGVGVSQTVPNPNRKRSSVSRDILAQGIANTACGLFRGLPVGGSLSGTALGVLAGASTRWTAILAGVWMAVILLAFPGLVSKVALATLGALLILAGASSIKVHEILAVWRTGWPSRLATMSTFFAVLYLPIQAAVALGVVLSALLYLNESSTDVSLVELVEGNDGQVEERAPPQRLTSDRVRVLEVYGHLFYAGARTLEGLLPNAAGTHHPVVIMRLRGRTSLGATMIDVLARYAEQLQKMQGRLYLTGISDEVSRQIVRTGKLELTGPVQVHEATRVLGESTREALAHAQTWLVGLHPNGRAIDENA